MQRARGGGRCQLAVRYQLPLGGKHKAAPGLRQASGAALLCFSRLLSYLFGYLYFITHCVKYQDVITFYASFALFFQLFNGFLLFSC